jgi:hypothetical protein
MGATPQAVGVRYARLDAAATDLLTSVGVLPARAMAGGPDVDVEPGP